MIGLGKKKMYTVYHTNSRGVGIIESKSQKCKKLLVFLRLTSWSDACCWWLMVDSSLLSLAVVGQSGIWTSLHGRDAKTYERANNVRVKKILSRVNLCKILRYFVEKVSNVAILRFLVAFLSTFWNFMLLFGIFLHYLGLLGLLRCFVAN